MAGVPFYLRSGKVAPPGHRIAIQFTQVPLALFGQRNLAGEAPMFWFCKSNRTKALRCTWAQRAPGSVMQIEPVKMRFSYAEAFPGDPPEAYERLLLDSLLGDATLFTRSDELKKPGV